MEGAIRNSTVFCSPLSEKNPSQPRGREGWAMVLDVVIDILSTQIADFNSRRGEGVGPWEGVSFGRPRQLWRY